MNTLATIFFFIQEFVQHFTIMYVGGSGFIVCDKFCFAIRLNMILITKIISAIVCDPLRIGILLTQFVFAPAFRHFPFFELFIFIAAIALYRNFYNGGIY